MVGDSQIPFLRSKIGAAGSGCLRLTLVMMLTACSQEQKATPTSETHSPPARVDAPAENQEIAGKAEEAPKEAARPSPTPPQTLGKTPKDEIPLAIVVPDKPGLVRSPFAPDQGFVSVEGVPSGEKVRCPYTKKIFKVP